MTTTTPWLPAQNPNTYLSGVSTIDAGETASLFVPNGGRGVVWIGVPAITSANLTFTVQPYPGATFRALKDASGATVTITAGTGGFTIAVPQLTGSNAFTIVSTQTQIAARAFQVDCVGQNPALALTNTSQSVTNDYQTAIEAVADITAGGTSWTTAHSPITAFTVTGAVEARVYAIVGATPLTSTGNTGTLAVGVANATTLFIPTTTVDGATRFIAGAVWTTTAPTGLAQLLPNTSGWVVVNGTPIIVTVAANNMTAGAISLYCQWKPIPGSTAGLVVPA